MWQLHIKGGPITYNEPPPLYKTTLEVWSTEKPYDNECGAVLNSLAEMNNAGTAYITVGKTELVKRVRKTRSWRLPSLSDWVAQFCTSP